MLKDSKYQGKSATTTVKLRLPSRTAVRRNQERASRPAVKDYSDSDDDAGDEEDDQEDDDDVSREGTRASAHTSGSRAKVPLTSMPPRGDGDHKYKEKKYEKVLVLFKKLKTEPNTYHLESKNPCDNCLGVWPCIMKRNAPKCRTCHGLPCSFYDPNAVGTAEFPQSKKTNHETSHKKSETTRSSSSSVSLSDEDFQFLSSIFSSPVGTPEKSRSELAPARKEVVDDVEDKESDEEKTDHKKIKPTKPSSSKATSSKRQLSELSELSELSYVDSSPVKPQKKSSRGSAQARKEVVVYVEDEESDEENPPHDTNHKKTKLTKPSSSRTTSSKRQLPESLKLSDLNSSPVKPQKKSRIESPPARKEVVDDDEDEESDEEKYEHNSRTCRRLLDKLESQKWYKRLEGKGHCLRDLVEMEKLHWRSINGPKGRRFEEVEQMGYN